MDEIQPLSHSTTNRKVLSLLQAGDLTRQRVLDVGAGEGYFCRLVGEHLRQAYGVTPAQVLRACDLFPESFRYPDVPCDPIDATGTLPYAADSFDVVCSLEVVEHLEDQFRFIRELHRVVKPGGRVIVTTPNLLNINSRLRYLRSGFWLLFDPLPLSARDPVHTAGHIHPITFYYLAYLFYRAGFTRVGAHFDRRKKSGVLWTALLAPFVLIGEAAFRWRLWRRKPALYRENEMLLRWATGWNMLTCRSVIVEGVK